MVNQLGIGKKDLYSWIMIIFFVIITGIMSVSSPQQVQLVAGAIIVLSVFFSPYMPISLYICTKIIRISFDGFWDGGLEAYTGMIAIYIIFINKDCLSNFGPFIKYLIGFFVVLLLSLLLSTKTSLMASITQVYNFLVCFAIALYFVKNKDGLITWALLVSGIMVVYLVWNTLRSGAGMEFDPTTGRLKYGEHVRALANALVFPIFYCVCRFIDAISEKVILKNSYWMAIALICIYFLILTVSRGAIFSVVVSLFLVYILRVSSSGIWTKLLLFSLLIGVLYFVQSIEFNQDYFFNKLDTFTGRDAIWEFYWTKQKQSGFLTVLFGFGPGNVMRVVEGSFFEGAYAHSFFAAFLFSYGVLGLLSLLLMVFFVGKRIWRSREAENIGFFVLTVLLFIPHGSEGTALFYYFFGVCIGLTIQRQQNKLTKIALD